MDVKRCNECGETKPIEMFAGNGREKDGLHSSCKVCIGAAYEARREKAKGKRKTNLEGTDKEIGSRTFAKALQRVADTPKLTGYEMKTCTKCKETKLVDMFSRNIHQEDGLNRWCRSCINAEHKAKNKTHFEENIPPVQQVEQAKPTAPQAKRRQVIHREATEFEIEIPRTPEQLEREAEIRRIAREERNKKALEYLHPKPPEMREKELEEKRAYRERTREIMQQQAQARDEAKLASVSQEALRILELHGLVTPKIRKSSTAEEIREYRRYQAQLRKARINANGGTHTRAEIRALLEAQNHRCAYCKRRVKLTEDHIIPLVQGGRHDIANICMACRRCNTQKNDRTPEQWVDRWYLVEPYNPDAP